ncbi:hypothetical protein [Pseudomonas serbica]|uniref:hypothetical protein n=1 Tax=Pseudomonas serbica TaxID=2965074 RepID=UPI00237B57CC|nr:hypothetical protein [Pseudomonas serbica]
MSTADCKELLVEAYPDTKAKEWKRTAKYLNGFDVEIRVFAHPVVGTVFVDEEEGEVITDPTYFETRQKSALKPSDFYFSIDSSHDCDDQLQVYLVLKDFYDKYGHVESTHLHNAVKGFFPKGLECDEEMEACFAIYSITDPEELKQMFLDSGFAYATFMESESA